MELYAHRPEAHFDLAIGDGGMRLKLAEARLTLSDEGISYTLDEFSGLRFYGSLRSVRIQAVHGQPDSPWEALIELVFDSGKPLSVYSSSPWGSDDPGRDPVFIAFVEEFHRRIPATDASRIRFLRGIPEARHRKMVVTLVVFLAILGGAGLLVLYKALDGTVPFFQTLFLISGLVGFGLWILHATEKSRPGAYRPDSLPRDLFPE